MATSYSAFVGALSGLIVMGVERSYNEPPQQVNTGDLPAMFPRVPQGSESGMTSQHSGGWPVMRADLVVLINPVMVDTTAANFDLALQIMDNLSVALRDSSLAKTTTNWAIRLDTATVGESLYWAVIAEVRANG